MGHFGRRNKCACYGRWVRDKANLVAESADWVRRMQKSLDQVNVRVHRAVSDLNGVTGMAIVRAIAAGERDAQKLAQLRGPTLSQKPRGDCRAVERALARRS